MKNRRRAFRISQAEALDILRQKSKSGRPVAAHSFVTRIAIALDCDLAKLCQICEEDPVAFLETLTASRGELIEVNVDPMWRKLQDYVDIRLAACLAIRQELERKLALDAKKQLAHRLRQET